MTLEKMQKNFNKKVGQISYDDLILASIVQKEVSNQEDMAKVAGIFLKRLKANMPLQSDATVNFATGKNTIQPTIDDIKTNPAYTEVKNQFVNDLKLIIQKSNHIMDYAQTYRYIINKFFPEHSYIFEATITKAN